MIRPYAEVIGDPIAQSKSPLIHGFWLDKLSIDADYRTCHIRADELDAYFAARRGDPTWRGCNITIPHKIAAMPLLDTVSRDASRVGAVNCAVRQGERLVGENTDVDGVLVALPDDLLSAGDVVCVIGAGGAARAALAACRRRDIARVLLSSRRPDNGVALLEAFDFGDNSRPIEDRGNLLAADVIINASPLGMTGAEPMPAAIIEALAGLAPETVVFDMVYAPLETEFLAAAGRAGCRTVSGIEMLIGQAAEAFRLFFGAPAPRAHDGALRALLTS